MVARTQHVAFEGTDQEAAFLAALAEDIAGRLPPGASVTVTLRRPWGLRVVHLDGCPCGNAHCPGLVARVAAIRRGPGRLRRAWDSLVRGARWLVGATIHAAGRP